MFKKRRGFATLAAAVGLSLTLTACGSGGGDAQTAPATFDPNAPATLNFSFWGNDVRAGYYKAAFDLFTKAHPNIKINSSVIGGFGEYWEKRQIEAAGGDLPDVMQFDYSYIRQYAETNLLLNLKPNFGNLIKTDGIPEKVQNIAKFNDAVVALPTGTNAWANFINTPLLNSLKVEPLKGGTTWDEYDDWMAKVAAAGGGKVFGGTDWSGTIQNFEVLLRSEGKTLYTDDGKAGFTKEQLTSWWAHGLELVKSGAVVPQQKLEEVYPKGGLGVGVATSELSWDNFSAGFAADLGVPVGTLDLIAPPVFVPGAKDLYLKPALMYAISAKSASPGAAALLVDFLINSPEVGAIFGTSRGLPASATQAAGVKLGPAEIKTKEYQASIAARLGDAPAVPIKGFGSLEQRFRELGDEVSLESLTVAEAVDQFFDAIETNS